MQKKEKKTSEFHRIAFDAALLVYAGLLFFLFFKQLGYGTSGLYESDTFAHVKFAVEDRFYHSFAAFIYVFLSWFPFMEVTISIVLSVCTVLTVLFTKKLLEYIFIEEEISIPACITNISAFVLNFVMAIYIRRVHYKHYIGYQSANMWHNSTYIFMRLFALLAIIYFLKIVKKYKDGLSAGEWIVFAALLALTTGFKPSFLTVFAPMFAIMLLCDLLRGVKFKRILAFGSTVFPAIAVMLWESLVLFAGEDSGYAFAPFRVLSERSSNPPLTVLLSVAFPLFVLIFHVGDFWKDKLYFGSLIMWGFGFAWVFFLAETGSRSLDGNFLWGYYISLFFLFIMSFVICLKDFLKKSGNRIFKIVRFVLSCCLLLGHLINGVWYFVLLLGGDTYFI